MELLQIMKKSPELKEIPVVMMSADGESEMMAQFLKSGAEDYLIKPIKPQIIKSLHNYVNLKKKSANFAISKKEYEIGQEVNFFFSLLTLNSKKIGSGVSSRVFLAKRAKDGKTFALKVMNLDIMAEDQRQRAENESLLLKLLVGPSIIRYYDSFKEDECLYILMEYAEVAHYEKKLMIIKMQIFLLNPNKF